MPCPDCVRPEHCEGRYPDDDPHRPGEVRGCFAEKARTAGFTSPWTSIVNLSEKQQSQDMAAYKRMRREGLQPRNVKGSRSAELLANERHQVEGTPDPKLLERYEIGATT